MASKEVLLKSLRLLQSSRQAACPLVAAVRSNSNQVVITKPKRNFFLRTYPTLVVNPDGSTITIQYKEPRKIVKLPIDASKLSEEELKREQKRRKPKDKIVVRQDSIKDNFDANKYSKFWKKKQSA